MIATQPFGSTGHDSTRIIFGAAALGSATQELADQTLQVLLDHGINHIDTAASYGASEDRIGPWMAAGHRSKFFLATKTGQRTYDAAKAEIANSFVRMQVDHIDLIQLHCLVTEDEWQTAFSADGALRAALEAREAGKVTFIGVTGHGLEVADFHLRSLERFAFDSVLFPYNFPLMSNPAYAVSVERLIKTCDDRGIAIQTIKSVTRRKWQEGATPFTTTWYEPLTEQPAIDATVAYVLSRPGLFLNTASDVTILDKVLDAESRFDGRRPSDDEMQALIAERDMEPLFA